MKILIIADLHLHHLPAWRLKWCEDFVDKMLDPDNLERLGLQLGWPLCLLGDVLEVRDKVDSRVLNLLLKLVTGWQGEVIWLVGQHDSLRPGYATLHELKQVENVTIIDDALEIRGDVAFVPFMRDLDAYREQLKKIADDSIVFTHVPTKEILEKYGAKDPQGLSIWDFARFRHTYSGDIHKGYDFQRNPEDGDDKTPRFSYIGAPGQRDWRDKGVIGVVGVFNSETGGLKRFTTEHPVHLEVNDEKEIPTDTGRKFIVRLPYGKTATGDNVLAATQKVALDMDSVQLVEAVDRDQVIAEYVKANPPPYESEKILAYAKDVLGIEVTE